MFHKMRDIVKAQGVWSLAGRSVAYTYRRGVRPFIPSKPICYAGVPTCYDRKWSDRLVPAAWVLGTGDPGDQPSYRETTFTDELSFEATFRDQPDYEATLVAGLNEMIKPGDSIVIVGGGVGVTAVIAGLRTGPSGSVQVFEGSRQYVRLIQRTAARNRVRNIGVHHAIVAKAIDVYGGESDVGTVMPPSKLPPCNVLQMDCEGAEVQILREMIIQPSVILVETHGPFGAPTDLVASLLERRGYVVSDRGVADPRIAERCTKQDIRVLLGTVGCK
jgi:hypothetical protein